MGFVTDRVRMQHFVTGCNVSALRSQIRLYEVPRHYTEGTDYQPSKAVSIETAEPKHQNTRTYPTHKAARNICAIPINSSHGRS